MSKIWNSRLLSEGARKIHLPQLQFSPRFQTSTFNTISHSNLRFPIGNIRASPFTVRYYQITQTKWDKIDKGHEKAIAQDKLEVDPESVSADSTVHPIFNEVGTENPERDVDMMAGIKSDFKTIRDTFSLSGVPREAYKIGLAGVLPYLATSLSTVYCAWEIRHAAADGVGFLMSGHSAELLLHILEPLQIGYGAVLISCLGTIHWGLEWAGYGGFQGYKRYMFGVIAPAVAWPTILLPAEYALITQFLAFNFLYYADTRATRLGWAPSWYGNYRFVLTFVVGASIVISLIGRGQIADRIGQLPGPADRIKAFREAQKEEKEYGELLQCSKESDDERDNQIQ